MVSLRGLLATLELYHTFMDDSDSRHRKPFRITTMKCFDFAGKALAPMYLDVIEDVLKRIQP